MTSYKEDLQELSRTLEAPLAQGANVKSVFGEPIIVGKKTVVPVAHLRYGFGGGLGSTEDEDHKKKGEKDKGSGGGFGAGLGAHPAGVLEITKKQTRFIPYKEGRGVGLVFALALGVGLGLMVGRGLKG